ncbi:GNAT family N-acetyltransferase [Streptomyces sp. UNOC14_S4]|uniref:GNAT family N-acetyltransferase n=1 Tax=Streptomyces sp. UNOC14_S4 TaxID=2872340 RepID=UPI001E293231|nr:GNAT family N-acetyltransferase [Streptomyces sp. UNOC14_S4]MCC3768176.1 GNAT family N-acetyltransferase [Streptomyces sp. UNOC14_S4]
MIEFSRYGQSDLPTVRKTVLDVYGEVYEGTDTFHATSRFAERLTMHSANPTWEAVIGYEEGEPIGFTYAGALSPRTRWWTVMTKPLPEDFTKETGTRTLALYELMVRMKWRKTGQAKKLHDELLAGRQEERVTLLVDPDHPKVKALYEEWDYQHIGHQQPFPDSPLYAVMLKQR